jgi:hypothetical protein
MQLADGDSNLLALKLTMCITHKYVFEMNNSQRDKKEEQQQEVVNK